MLKSIELEIVKKYINKSKQERIIWELNNPKKRRNIMLERFSSPEIFDNNCIRLVDYMPPNELERYLFQLSRVEEVYFIGEDYIGELSLREATLKANTGELCIIYCGKGIGYYQGEQEQGKPPRYLLQKK